MKPINTQIIIKHNPGSAAHFKQIGYKEATNTNLKICFNALLFWNPLNHNDYTHNWPHGLLFYLKDHKSKIRLATSFFVCFFFRSSKRCFCRFAIESCFSCSTRLNLSTDCGRAATLWEFTVALWPAVWTLQHWEGVGRGGSLTTARRLQCCTGEPALATFLDTGGPASNMVQNLTVQLHAFPDILNTLCKLFYRDSWDCFLLLCFNAPCLEHVWLQDSGSGSLTALDRHLQRLNETLRPSCNQQ